VGQPRFQSPPEAGAHGPSALSILAGARHPDRFALPCCAFFLGEVIAVAADENAERERRSIVRALRQELESLRRAGLDRIPAAPPARPAAAAAAAAEKRVPARPTAAAGSAEPPPEEKAPPPAQHAGTLFETEPPAHQASRPWALAARVTPLESSLFGASAFDLALVPPCDRPAALADLAGKVSVCTKCRYLAETRTQTVFGTGSPEARLMFIGEAPGADEDRLGEPFVGRAGRLLNDMITRGMGLTREQVYIANILKCRPPENRNPLPDEMDNCLPYLEEQIATIRPGFLCLLGRVALTALLKTSLSMNKARGKWHHYRGIPAIVTFHPAYLLRRPDFKKEAWEDLQMLMKEMGLKPPPRAR
jgi:DNA polymerase